LAILSQFVFRLALGLAVAMVATSPKHVTSGFFRVHLWVIMALDTLACLIAPSEYQTAMWLPLSGAVVSYMASVAWLYGNANVGRPLMAMVAAINLAGAWYAATLSGALDHWLMWFDAPTSGLLLGTTMAAMLLGHWYLNTPTMKLDPLKTLIALIGIAVVLRMGVVALGLGIDLSAGPSFGFREWSFVGLRWGAGLLGTLALAWMAWQTLKIPNTQSATGILYVAVITTFLGELCSLLLSSEQFLPL